MELLKWILPLYVLGWLIFDIYRNPKRGPRTAIGFAICAAFMAWLVCMAQVDWLTTIPIQLWWLIALLAGVNVAVALWPRQPLESYPSEIGK